VTKSPADQSRLSTVKDRPFSHDRSLAVQFEYKGLGGDNSMLYYHPYF